MHRRLESPQVIDELESPSSELCQCGDHLDLHEGTEGKAGDGYGGPRGFVSLELLFVDVIHFGEIRHALEEDGGLGHILKGEALAGEQGTDVGKDLPGLAFHVGAGNLAFGGINGDLAGAVEELLLRQFCCLGVGADGLGGTGGVVDQIHKASMKGKDEPGRKLLCSGEVQRRCGDDEVLGLAESGDVASVKVGLHGVDGPLENEALVGPAPRHGSGDGLAERETTQSHGRVVLGEHLACADAFQKLCALCGINLVIQHCCGEERSLAQSPHAFVSPFHEGEGRADMRDVALQRLLHEEVRWHDPAFGAEGAPGEAGGDLHLLTLEGMACERAY